jgi:hypothetical protein
MSYWNSLYRYLKQTKMSFFKNEQEGKAGPVWGLYQWEGEDKRVWKVNMVEILLTHV